MSKTIRSNGTMMWRSLEFMWNRNRNIFQRFMGLTEITRLPALYKTQTGYKHLYNGKVTLKYISWLYRHHPVDLVDFFRKKFLVF